VLTYISEFIIYSFQSAYRPTFIPPKEGRNVRRILVKIFTPQTEGMEEEVFWGGRL